MSVTRPIFENPPALSAPITCITRSYGIGAVGAQEDLVARPLRRDGAQPRDEDAVLGTSVVWICSPPRAVSVTVSGSSCSVGSDWPPSWAVPPARPTVSSGAATMKMISSTSITSTKGVTLISAIGRVRARFRRASPALIASG